MLTLMFFSIHTLSQFNPHPPPHTERLGKEFGICDTAGQCKWGGTTTLKRTGVVQGYTAVSDRETRSVKDFCQPYRANQ